jgi:hypothetical protein
VGASERRPVGVSMVHFILLRNVHNLGARRTAPTGQVRFGVDSREVRLISGVVFQRLTLRSREVT